MHLRCLLSSVSPSTASPRFSPIALRIFSFFSSYAARSAADITAPFSPPLPHNSASTPDCRMHCRLDDRVVLANRSAANITTPFSPLLLQPTALLRSLSVHDCPMKELKWLENTDRCLQQ